MILFQSLAAVLLYYNRQMGMRTSGLLFLFWFLLALCGSVQFRHILRDPKYQVSLIIFNLQIIIQ